jgi:excisionase family DNA binding protein
VDRRIEQTLFRKIRVFRVKADKLGTMKTARKTIEAGPRDASPALSVNIDIDPLVEVVRRHVKLTPQAKRLIEGDFARLFRHPAISGSARKATAVRSRSATDSVLSTQEAADLVGVSRPYIVARIEAGDIALHQQVGNQRRVLKSAVLAWHRQEQNRRRKALGQLGADLDREIFAG